MATDTLRTAGDEIDSGCLKCKDVTNHTIIAVVEEKIVKVQCNVCGGRHNYRPVQDHTAKKKTAPGRKAVGGPSARSVNSAADNYAKMLKGRNLGDAMPYAMTTLFGKDDLVNHPTFGVGLVTATIPPDKIELTFNEGPKIFVCHLKNTVLAKSGGGDKARKRKIVRKASSSRFSNVSAD